MLLLAIAASVLIVFALTATAVLLLALPPAHRWFVPGPRPPPAAYVLPPGYLICPDPAAHPTTAPADPATPPTWATTPPGDPSTPIRGDGD
ncbi:hypothetical protein JNW88_20500 [Micromonospora sp. ATA32]|nr:hypothetical protein [Micromonospora sp. ATA32]